MMRPTLCLAAVLFLVPVSVSAGGGYAHGEDHCYFFTAPKGWLMDNNAAASEGVPMVFYPSGSSWATAEVAMYTRPSNRSPQAQSFSQSVRVQVNEVVTMYRGASQNVEAKMLRAVKSQSGVTGELWQLSGYSSEGSELAVYFPGSRTVNYFVAQVPRGANVEASTQALIELAGTYREGTDCKPCSGRKACAAN